MYKNRNASMRESKTIEKEVRYVHKGRAKNPAHLQLLVAAVDKKRHEGVETITGSVSRTRLSGEGGPRSREHPAHRITLHPSNPSFPPRQFRRCSCCSRLLPFPFLVFVRGGPAAVGEADDPPQPSSVECIRPSSNRYLPTGGFLLPDPPTVTGRARSPRVKQSTPQPLPTPTYHRGLVLPSTIHYHAIYTHTHRVARFGKCQYGTFRKTRVHTHTYIYTF